MLFWRGARAAACDYVYIRFGKGGTQHQRVRYHTYIGIQSENRYIQFASFGIFVVMPFPAILDVLERDAYDFFCFRRPERILVYDRIRTFGFARRVPYVFVDFPSMSIFDAMLDRQPFAFVRVQIVVTVRITRKYDMRTGVFDIFYYVGNDALRLFASQYPVDKIVLQVDGDNEILFVHI